VMDIWFTSDTHFGHKNIIKYSNRPFDSIDEHDEALITYWNETVKEGDTIYHLGDFAFKKWGLYLPRLKGNKHLIIGNHDPGRDDILKKTQGHWLTVEYYRELKTPCPLVLFHYPIRDWNRAHHDVLHLHGHEHGALLGNDQMLDVGVDCWNYRPVNIDQIKERLKTLPAFQKVGHHNGER
jgi:calcineurin-like phosphoesterase family protein